MRVLLVTARRASRIVRRVAEKLGEATGWEVTVEVAPLEIASLIPPGLLEKLLARHRGRVDYAIVPGTLDYDVHRVGERAGVRVVKGPEDPTGILVVLGVSPALLREMMERGRIEVTAALGRLVETLREIHSSKPAIELCGVRVPARPPPAAVAAEVYAPRLPGGAVEEMAERAIELLGRGADIIVAGFGFEAEPAEQLRAVKKLYDAVGPVAVDTPHPGVLVEAARQGYSCLAFSATIDSPLLERLPRGAGVVVIPATAAQGAPRDPLERVALLEKGVREAQRRGLVTVADPIVDPPMQGLVESLYAAKLASQKLPETTPVLAGAANAYELVDADSHGVIALLTALLVEAGASIILATEESWKTRMAVTETAIAATMASLALAQNKPPKDLGVDLLVVKEKRPRENGPPKHPAGALAVDGDSLGKAYGLRMDPRGTHVITVDREKRTLVDIAYTRHGTVVVEATRAKNLYRAVAYLGLAAEPTHHAYLGYELCKAELALRLGKSYQQDTDIITPAWEKNTYYNTRQMKPAKPGKPRGKGEH